MRIRQLARKLDVQDDEIRAFLKENQAIEIEDNPNAKLDEEQVAAVEEHFKKPEPEPVEEPVEATLEVDEEIEDEEDEKPTPLHVSERRRLNVSELEAHLADADEEASAGATNDSDEENTSASSADDNSSEDGTESSSEEGEIIKAPKIDLPGPKVIGQIDLPEKVEREMPQVEIDGVMYDKRPSRRRKPSRVSGDGTTSRREQRRRSGKRKISAADREERDKLQEKYLSDEEKAAINAKKREAKKAAEAAKKKKQAAYYAKQQAKNTPPKKKKKKQVKQEMETVKAPEQDPPKSALGKLWRWFNTP